MVDSTEEGELFCKLEMDALIFFVYSLIIPSETVCIAEALGIFSHDNCPYEHNNF